MTLDLDALEQKARAATHGTGAWIVQDDGMGVRDDISTVAIVYRMPTETTARYIAAASPDVVLALIASLRAAEDNNAELIAMLDRGMQLVDDSRVDTCAELRTKLDAAESRATRAEEQRDRLAEALRDVAHYAGPPEGTEWLHMQQEARAALAEVGDGVVGGGG